ncbi:MAG: adenosylcobinamide-GDP ribazoletransferase [Planctomycetaceae bacterium]|nr:adenosylcobinamide-GDP ribazoletransferase [Planctomycetaceae bacterium]
MPPPRFHVQALMVARAFRLAVAFLTVIPVRLGEGEVTEADLAASRFAYPAVGIAIGLVLAGWSEALRLWGIDPAPAAFLLVAAGVAITGGLHLDGLADTGDGLFLRGDASRRLAVMRDPHVGSFGVTAVVLVLLGKYAALSHATGPSRSLAVLGAATVGRTLILVAAGTSRYARLEGTGRVLIDAATPYDAFVAASGTLAFGALLAGRAGLAAAAAALGLAWGLTQYASRKLGGITGDLLGALVELTELVFLVILRSEHIPAGRW